MKNICEYRWNLRNSIFGMREINESREILATPTLSEHCWRLKSIMLCEISNIVVESGALSSAFRMWERAATKSDASFTLIERRSAFCALLIFFIRVRCQQFDTVLLITKDVWRRYLFRNLNPPFRRYTKRSRRVLFDRVSKIICYIDRLSYPRVKFNC